jgi:hypothetical protein
MKGAAWLVSGVLISVPLSARADECTEVVPPGATKPTLTEKIVPRALAGHAVDLEILVRHGAGESATLPADLPRLATGEVRVADDGRFAKGALPETAVDPGDPTRATTLLKVPFVVLSTTLERKTFTIPKVRVIVLRKGGGDLSVCTTTHEVAIDQPIANTPDPEPRPNPPSQPQRTIDERAKLIATVAAISAAIALAIGALIFWLRRRPKAPVPPPPPPPSWQTALDEIRAARRALQTGAIDDKGYYDRISDALRAHLGRVYGFDGLESTTDELLARLRRYPSPGLPIIEIEALAAESDLVKFAGLSPTADEIGTLADRAERIVRATAQTIPLRAATAPRAGDRP